MHQLAAGLQPSRALFPAGRVFVLPIGAIHPAVAFSPGTASAPLSERLNHTTSLEPPGPPRPAREKTTTKPLICEHTSYIDTDDCIRWLSG